jgi:tRNA dimethylallyltransferase
MNGKAGAPKATPHVNAAVEADICHLRSGGGGWEAGVHMLAQAGDPVTAYSLPHNDWYQLRRSLEIVKVFIVLQVHSYTLFGLHLWQPVLDSAK